MIIKTKGKTSKTKLSICKKAIDFYGKMLLGALYPKISVNIIFEKRMNDHAFCVWEDKNFRGREFTITIDHRLSKKETLLTLAHEMVHVKQYAKGEIKDYLKSERVRWKNNIFEPDKIDYWDQEWEIEAFGRERGLYVRFNQSMKE